MLKRLRLLAATLYWLFYVFVFIALTYTDDEGGIPLIILGLPWSILVEFTAYSAGSVFPSFERFLISEAGNFFASVLVCGTLNATVILGVSRVVRWLRRSPLNPAICALVGIALLASVQLASPMIERDALERNRPQNVPAEAVRLIGFPRTWQHCTYDSARNIDLCRIWNRKGVILAEGEFVPYDNAAPVTPDQLEIKSENSMPQTVALRNGRVLIEKAREEDMRRFLDSFSGNR